MLQDIPIQTPTLCQTSSCVLETERLTLRRPTLADVKAIAHLANDRRIAENTRRLPHPYLQDHAVEFVRANATDNSETVFLIEHNYSPIGMVGIDRADPDAPELALLARRRALGPGFRHRSRTRRDRFFLRGVRRRTSDFGRPLRQPGVAKHPGEMRLPVERCRVAPLRSAGMLDPGRPLPPDTQRVGITEELGKFDAKGAIGSLDNNTVVPANAGTHNHRTTLLNQAVESSCRSGSLLQLMMVGMGPGSRFAWPGRRLWWISRRRIDHRFFTPELLFSQEDINARADDDGGADEGRD
ncbi:hypothetical protein V1290_003596 [Bradyrhizobium sp. AZCC 1578]